MLRLLFRSVICRDLPSTLTPSSPLLSFWLKSRSFSNESAGSTPGAKLTGVRTLVEGCDYEHWLVVMEPPKGFPRRDEIIDGYIKTLSIALGSEEEAKNSIYSVSTKYYYAFGCKVGEKLTHKIKSFPGVRWILPDCYLDPGQNDYGGEPFIEGKVVPYEQKYHAAWLHDQHDANDRNHGHSKKTKRKEKKLGSMQGLNSKPTEIRSHLAET